MQKIWNISGEQNNMLHIRIPQNNTLKEHKSIYTFLTISISTHSPSSSGLKTRLFLSRTNLGKTQDFENKVLRNKGIGILSEKEELFVNFPRLTSAPAQYQCKSHAHSVRQYFPLNPKTFFFIWWPRHQLKFIQYSFRYPTSNRFCTYWPNWR